MIDFGSTYPFHPIFRLCFEYIRTMLVFNVNISLIFRNYFVKCSKTYAGIRYEFYKN